MLISGQRKLERMRDGRTVDGRLVGLDLESGLGIDVKEDQNPVVAAVFGCNFASAGR